MKIHFGIFGEDQNYGVSILANIAFEKGWDNDIYCYPYNVTEEEIEKSLADSNPDLVALSFMLCGRPDAFKVAKIAKKMGIKIFAGGVHPSTCPDDLVESGLFDAIIVGDGMGVFEEVLESYENFKNEIIIGKQHSDINKYMQRYFSERQKSIIKQSKTFRIFSNFGCPYNCYFCPPRPTGFIRLPLKIVVEELKKAKEEFGIERIIFYDDTFTMDANRISEFRRQLERNNLSFIYQTPFARADTFTEKVAQELKLFGMEEFMFGVEAASEKLLNFLNKKITVADIHRASELCNKYNFRFKITLMVGIPTQTKDDYEQTLEFVKQTLPQQVIIHIFTPFPKTYLRDYCVKNGYIPEEINFDNYLGADPHSKGFRGFGEKPMLRNIDYEMAFRYKNEIEKVVDLQKESWITEVIKKANRHKWILFGTGEYFYEVLKKAGSLSLKNCIGYYDYDDSGFKGQSFYSNIPKYDFYKGAISPDLIVVTSHKQGKTFKQLIDPMIRQDFRFTGEIISVSSYER